MTSTPSLPAQIEAREPGWYWVRVREDGPWLPCCWHYSDGESFWLARSEPFWMARSEDDQPILEIGPRIPDPVTLQQQEAVVEAARMVWEVERLHEEANIRGGKLLELGRCLAALGTAPETPNTDIELVLARRDTAQNTAAR